MAGILFSETDSSSTSIFDLFVSDQKLKPQPESLPPPGDIFNKLNGNENNENSAGSSSNISNAKNYSEEIENGITDALDQLSTSYHQNSPNYSDEDCEDGQIDGENKEARKKVRVGNYYQARIPKYLGSLADVGCADADEEEDLLLWNPCLMDAKDVETFLKQLDSITKNAIPMGIHLRDNEQALYVLQQNNYNVEYTLQLLRTKNSSPSSLTNSSERVSDWTEEECKNFESGILNYGKNFYLIQKNKVSTRSVGELVQFYYLWKKSERFDFLATRIRAGKKKYSLNPGISDLMVRYFGNYHKTFPNKSDVQLLLSSSKKVTASNSLQY